MGSAGATTVGDRELRWEPDETLIPEQETGVRPEQIKTQQEKSRKKNPFLGNRLSFLQPTPKKIEKEKKKRENREGKRGG